jgi:hypothetical protein
MHLGEIFNDNEIDDIIKKVMENVKEGAAADVDGAIDGSIDDCFNEYLLSSVNYGLKDGKKVAYFPCDTCKQKQVIIEQYNKVCNRQYIPPYVDPDCADFKLALIVDRIDEDIIEKIFRYLVFRISIRDIARAIADPEWRRQAEDILRVQGYSNFINDSFGKFTKKQIIQLLFDINYFYFDLDFSRNLDERECICMLKYYIVLVLRNRIKESLFRIVKLIELELEYKIAVIESEIRYLIKCILQEIAITPLPAANYNITYFNKIGTLTELLKIFDGMEGGKHDERSDFRHIRDTIIKFEKVIRTTLDLLNKKIKEFEALIGQRKFIVGVTGICERPNVFPSSENGLGPVVVPPQPVVILNPKTSQGGSED